MKSADKLSDLVCEVTNKVEAAEAPCSVAISDIIECTQVYAKCTDAHEWIRNRLIPAEQEAQVALSDLLDQFTDAVQDLEGVDLADIHRWRARKHSLVFSD